jgi:hypothetical protein
LRCSALSLRRTGSTPHSTRFARLELGLFTKSSILVASYEFITLVELVKESYHGTGVPAQDCFFKIVYKKYNLPF